MPKRTDIEKILIIGSGPIIIGQACEFDYSGTQACKALRGLGYKIVLVNSNPATIMTDPVMADVTYIEPLNIDRLTEIIEKERPCAVLPNLGGQSGLNLCLELSEAGVLDKYNVKVIGVNLEAINRGEDRILFKEAMKEIGVDMPASAPAYNLEEAEGIAKDLGYPVVIRPAFTMGGTGGGIAYNVEELRTIASRGLAASIINQVLIEECILGWEELELEIVRDSEGNMITVCFIENIDPVGVHTGDSICSAPMLTISEELQAELQRQAYAIVDSIGIIGGTNTQFAHNPKTGKIVVIEINPRTSRSSALASKATGFPIALVSALLAAGLTLKDLPYKDTTLDRYKPGGDYVVIKFPRFAFEKFKGAEDILGTQMRAVGEVMAIGRTYKEAFLKAIRALETGRCGLGFAKNFGSLSKEELLLQLKNVTSERPFILYEALRKGASVEELAELTKIKAWFIEQMAELLALEEEILTYKGKELPEVLHRKAKQDGFSDLYLARLLGVKEDDIRTLRKKQGITVGFESIIVSGVKDASYFYSTYHTEDKLPVSNSNKKVLILGGGPNRIGQGIEFDYCCVHAAFALRDMGFETIMINCNPETVSTDYDTSDKLYFEPLTIEDVMAIVEKEKPCGAIVSFGGQTPLNIAAKLEELGLPILGTTPDVIELAEDRDRFRIMMEEMGIPMPEAGMAADMDEAVAVASKIGYPVMVRPSFVLGGRAMEVVYDEAGIRSYVERAENMSKDAPILIDRFLSGALECEADAVADGENVFVPTVMEHIEYAGIHSGDSACVIPPIGITAEQIEVIEETTRRIAGKLGVVGLMNIQYAISEGKVYVLEANPRASRTVPLVSKVCNIPMARLATELMVAKINGGTIDVKALKKATFKHIGVKEAVFPFNMFPEVDPVLGPEMRSTGEVLSLATNFGMAYFKALEGAKILLPAKGRVFISVSEADKAEALTAARSFAEQGFTILATKGTAEYFEKAGLAVQQIQKLHEGRPNIADEIVNGSIDLIINTPCGNLVSEQDDSYIRKSAIKNRIPYITTTAAAIAAAQGIKAYIDNHGQVTVKSLQEYHTEITF